jgi:hypothetical protein
MPRLFAEDLRERVLKVVDKKNNDDQFNKQYVQN